MQTLIFLEDKILRDALYLQFCFWQKSVPQVTVKYYQNSLALNYRNECFDEIVADDLANFIYTRRQSAVLWQLIYAYYDCFSPAEKNLLHQKCVSMLKAERNSLQEVCSGRENFDLADDIVHRIREYRSINLDGLMTFAFPHYLDYLKTTLLITADEILNIEEDRNYFQLLQNLGHKEHSSIEELHIFYHNQEFLLLEKKDGQIRQYANNEEIIYWDVLIGKLIYLAPQQITFHLSKITNKFVQETVEQIFCNRISFLEH